MFLCQSLDLVEDIFAGYYKKAKLSLSREISFSQRQLFCHKDLVPITEIVSLRQELCSFHRDCAPVTGILLISSFDMIFLTFYDISLHFVTININSDKYFVWGRKILCHLGWLQKSHPALTVSIYEVNHFA
jgi:hypothetical protein